jgi:cytidylate kinase
MSPVVLGKDIRDGALHRNIVIGGLTAAGKTTHAKILAAETGYTYVSGTGTLARLLGVPVPEDPPYWPDIAAEVAKRRSDDVDRALEEELLDKAASSNRQVFDVWALPWTSRDPRLIRLWIESTLESRAWKCQVSQGARPSMTMEQCRAYVKEKDDANRDLFRRTLGFDLYAEREVFNVALDNSALIGAPTRAAADAGIRAFAPVVRAAVDACHGMISATVLSQLAAANGTPTVVEWLHT